MSHTQIEMKSICLHYGVLQRLSIPSPCSGRPCDLLHNGLQHNSLHRSYLYMMKRAGRSPPNEWLLVADYRAQVLRPNQV